MNKVSQKKTKQGFTLIELLIVIGILAILVVTALLALNPAEAMKKSRDATRVKDLSTLEAIIQRYYNEGATETICSLATGCSSGGINTTTCAAGNNWLGVTVDLCKYAPKIPIDPLNDTTGNKRYVTSTGVITAGSIMYKVKTAANGTYIICVRQESAANASVVGSEGVDNNWLVKRNTSAFGGCAF